MNLIEKVRFWARHNSVRLAVVAGPIASALIEHRSEIEPYLQEMPPIARIVMTLLVFTVLPTWLRVKPQASVSGGNGQ